jgi:LysR family cys regulon transcriptional activator
MLLDTQNLRRIADQFASRETGHFVVATTHTQARYALPQIIKWFKTGLTPACTSRCTKAARSR